LKVLLDVDTGVDDAIAVVLALNSPELEVLAITTVAGNASMELCARNTLLLTELLGSGVPVARGARRPLRKRLLTAPEVHGPDGLGGPLGTLPPPLGSPVEEPAHELVARIGRENPEEVVLVATGPLTNLANALENDRDALSGYRRIVAMAGAFDVPGNTGPLAEFNVYVDPDAAQRVLSSGANVTVVPLDATTRAALPRSELGLHLGAATRAGPRPGRNAARVLHRALDYYMTFQKAESGLDAGYMHDPLAVASVLMPAVLRTERGGVRIVTEGPDRGRTLRESGSGGDVCEADIAVDADPEILTNLLRQRVLSPIFGEPGSLSRPGSPT
jgi:inosine-uridine nucleoside N-ribohydrolase